MSKRKRNKPVVFIKTHRGYINQCPSCGYKVDSQTSVGMTASTPFPGALTICLKCGEIMKFGPKLELQMFPLKELMEASPEQKKMIDILKELVKWNKEHETNPASDPSRKTDRLWLPDERD